MLIDFTPLSDIDEVLKISAEKKTLLGGVLYSKDEAENILTTFECIESPIIYDDEDDDIDDIACEVYEVKIEHVSALQNVFKTWATNFVNQPDTTEQYRNVDQDNLKHGMITSYMEYLDALVVYEDVEVKKAVMSEITNVMDRGIFIDNKNIHLLGFNGDHDGW